MSTFPPKQIGKFHPLINTNFFRLRHSKNRVCVINGFHFLGIQTPNKIRTVFFGWGGAEKAAPSPGWSFSRLFDGRRLWHPTWVVCKTRKPPPDFVEEFGDKQKTLGKPTTEELCETSTDEPWSWWIRKSKHGNPAKVEAMLIFQYIYIYLYEYIYIHTRYHIDPVRSKRILQLQLRITQYTLESYESRNKKPLTFHDTGCLIGILMMVYFHDHKSG